MVLNATSANLFPVEANLRDFAYFDDGKSTVLAVYDSCKDDRERYEYLTKKIVKQGKSIKSKGKKNLQQDVAKPVAESRGIG